MIKKRMRTWLAALVVAVVLACGFATPAQAVTSDAKGEVTLRNIEAGASIDVYHIITVTWDDTADQPKEPVYVWSTVGGDKSVANWVKIKHPDYIDAQTNAVTDAFNTDDKAKTFYDELSAAIKNGEVALPAEQPTVTAVEGGTTFRNLALGTHLFIIGGGENNNYIYQPVAQNVVPVWKDNAWVVDNPSQDVAVKREETSIDKKIDGTKKIVGAQYGDVINYDLNVPVPQYPANAIKKLFYISDKLSTGLTLDESSIKVYGVNGDEETLLVEGTDYELTKTDSKGNAVSFGINMNEPYYDKVKGYQSIHVDYNAVVNNQAVIGETGNPNEAKLEFNNNPYDEQGYKTDTDETKVYTFGIDIVKLDKDGKTPLSGAEFNLSKHEDGSEPMQFVEETPGVYHLYNAENDKGATPTTTIKVDDKGKLNIKGLNEGVYYLVETKAPDGYVKPSGAVKITITASKDGQGNMTGHVEGEVTVGYVHQDVLNDKGFELPETGGPGTVALTAAGVVLMVGAAALIVRGRKQN